jgi:hypothetical protein
MEILNNISEAERGGLLDLGKALRHLMLFGGEGGGTGSAQAAGFSEFRAGTATDKYISPSVYFEGHAAYTLTDTATIPVNFDYGINFLLTISQDRVLSNPINTKNGQSGIFVIQQDSVGGHDLEWGVNYKFTSGPPTLPQAAHAWIIVRYFVQAPTVIRCTVEATGDLSLNASTVEELWLALESLKYISPSVLIEAEVPVDLVDEETIFIDFGEGKNFRVTITDDRTVDTPLDQMPGRYGEITVIQDAIGGHDLTWHSDWKFDGGLTPTIRTEANAETVFHYRVIGVGNVRLTKEPESATVSDVWSGTARDKFLSPYSAFEAMADVTLVDGASIVPNLNQGLTFALTLGANRHISNPIGQRSGKQGRFYIQQNETGGYAVTWDTDYKFVGGVTPVIPIAPNAWTIVPYEVRSPGNIIATSVDTTASSGGGEAVPAASVAEVRSAAAVSKYVSPSSLAGLFVPYSLPNASSVLPDLDLGVNFIVTLQQNVTIQNISHQRVGANGTIIIVQGGSGGYSVTWDTNYSFMGGTPSIASPVGSWIIVPYVIQAFGVIRCMTIQSNVIPAAATASEVWVGTATGKYITPSIALAASVFQTLTDGAVINIDLNTGINFKVTIAGNRALANPTNQVAGKEGVLKIKQDAIGGRTISFGDNYVIETGSVVLADGPNEHTTIPYHVESAGVVLIG